MYNLLSQSHLLLPLQRDFYMYSLLFPLPIYYYPSSYYHQIILRTRLRASKLIPSLLANSKSFTASFHIIHPPLLERPCPGPFSALCLGSSKDSKEKIPFLIQCMSISTSSLSVSEQVMPEDGVELLSSVEDLYGGVRVDMVEPMDPKVFSTLLKASMSHWRQQGKNGIWIKLPIELANLVEAAVKEGFRYHHAEPDYLMLVCWIPDTIDTLPANASHRVGIGAFVMNHKREVLVVQETSGKFKGSGVWKMPTGVTNEGEDISTAAIREVKEETGIETEFVEVLAFRQSHKSFFGKSDLFFVCLLQPHSYDIQKQDTEILEAQWMPVEDYAAQSFVQKHEMFKLVANVCLAKLDKDYAGFTPVPTTTSSGKTSYLYCNKRYLELQPTSAV